MSERSAWQHLTVREFLEEYNWSGQKSGPVPTSANPPGRTVSWQRQTVQTFFSQFNWAGHPLEPQELVSSPLEFSTRLTVNDFFQFFTWEGQPNIAAIPEIPKSSPSNLEDDLNLNDFSNLF